ncbi:phosphoribosylglycinamide formyltransferase [Alkalibaculum sp. M08DMB]|uniref:Phosphoribosylglycinamide formyltransferase n=1 Tax=Alkalibaculum sporogenes TaxID=2655001 RepID=A0A6A7K686_9FIRM|nr:phosphoribosylglycinamide formyltransferase [Alkalibaculum sporogenes]MPW24958.1 phosphoribosylglycinamide formyltransferase [Alkalibaculum sporogenes]
MALKKIAVFISGGGSNLQVLIDEIHQKYGEIVLVLSSNSNAHGLMRGKNNEIKSIVFDSKESDFDEKVIAILEENHVDFIVLAGYLKIISSKLVNKYPGKIINIHPSLIPSFCGANHYGLKVHEKAIEYGVKISGATVHFVDEGADTGPIIMQKTVSVDYEDTAETLQKKVLDIEHYILCVSVKKMCEDKLILKGRKVKVL